MSNVVLIVDGYFIFYYYFFYICVCYFFFFFSSRRRHTRWTGDWSSDVCSSDLLGDLHPYIALALEMRKRYIDPVIATSRTYRERIESLNIEFREIRPTALEPDTPEYFEMVEKVVDPQRGAEYLFKELLVPSVHDMYANLREAIEDADLLVTHPLILAGPLVAQKTGIPWVSTELAPSSLWSAFDPFVPPNMPWFHRVLKAGGPIATRLYMKLVKA